MSDGDEIDLEHWDGTPVPLPSYGPDWDAAEAYGFDMHLMEFALRMTPQARVRSLQDMLDLRYQAFLVRERERRGT